MNTDAFTILNKKRLKTTSLYTLDEINKLPLEKEIFLRYNNQSKTKNKVVDCKYILDNMEELKSQLKTKELLQIVESIRSIAGGVIYIRDGFIYGEYVEGNIIMLLRRGICGKRFIVTPHDDIYEISVFQNWICREKPEYYEWAPFNGIISNGFKTLMNSIIDAVDKNERDLLLEILIEDNRIIFCDAKYKNVDISSDGLFNIFRSEENIFSLKGNSISDKILKIDGFDIDNFNHQLPKNVGVCNGAILSHYITYNINNMENLIYIRG